MRLIQFLVGLAVACGSAAAQADGEHRRRLAAELAVIAGDVRRLADDPVGALERRGLQQRLASALSSLPLLVRRAGVKTPALPDLRHALERRDWRRLSSQLDTLGKSHPFDATALLGAASTPRTLALGAAIHKAACAGCHDSPSGQDTLLPAKNLSAQIKTMPGSEFAARLWLGVRGDKTTALANPFNDAELAALIAWYDRAR